MPIPKTLAFDPATFLAEAGLGKKILEFTTKQRVFSQGDSADSVFYIQKGRVRLLCPVVAWERSDSSITESW